MATHPFDSYRLGLFEPLEQYESRFYLGYALSMMLSFRLKICLVAYAFALAIVAAPSHSAFAQIPSASVETYPEATASDPNASVMPEGMSWNRPLRAGDMVLPRLSKPKTTTAKQPTILPSRLAPVAAGEPKAPQIGTVSGKEAKAPQLTQESNSTQSMMLLSGMKSALKQAGQNPDLPKSDIVPVDADDTQGKALAQKAQEKKQQALAPVAPPQSIVALPAKDAGGNFVAGQEPKVWGSANTGVAAAGAASALSSSSTQADTPAQKLEFGKDIPAAKQVATVPTVKPADDGMMDIVWPPEMVGGAPQIPAVADDNTATPKATEMSEAPVALEHAEVAKKKDESGFMDRLTKPFTSIFGEAVDDRKEAAASSRSAPQAAKTADGATCEPVVTKWTRECGAAGYPPHFVGQILGETRVECPSGEAKDVWLSNNCAAPIASSSYAVQDTKTASNAPSSSASSSSMVADADTSVDGLCGVASGLASDGKPAADLCSQGEASSVSGDGPWRWTCKGRRGGMTVSCAAPVASGKDAKKAGKTITPNGASAQTEILVEDGKCGDAISQPTENAPSSNLCAKGTPSLVNGSGPWTWACSGTNGGTAAACTANKKIDGICGIASGTGTDTMPMRDLCSAGYASAVTGNGPWNWTCSGLHGGAPVTCSATAKLNAVCGAATSKGFHSAPTESLCSVGTASAVSGEGPWSWSCQGESGGATVPCKASVMTDGVCGTANGNQYSKAPSEELCSQGVATRVTGLGPWNWNCTGVYGGATASCTAVLGGKETSTSSVACGVAAEVLALAKPSQNLCAAGVPGDVSGSGPWTWSCSDKSGHSIPCSTLTATTGACGKAADVMTKTAPVSGLCKTGTPSEVVAFEKKSWKWECQGAMGTGAATCYAPMYGGVEPSKMSDVALTSTPEAMCGSAAGQGSHDKPDSNLCEAGKPSAVRGNGPWSWTCGTKTKVTCEAPKVANGSCGSSHGSILRSAPTNALCSSGSATDITGNGPWMWTCVGSGGGSSASCSASAQSQTKVDGACGAAANAVVTEAPSANLCDSGMPSTVYGDGPWTWACSGMNGGIASTCKTSKTVPKAPPPPGPAVNGVCGSSNGVAADSAPEEITLCSSGTPTAISGQGPWNWGCIGANGGMTVSCTAPLTPPAPIVGACGAASGVPTLTTPKSGLCSAGIMSAVSGKGPWTWSCSGTNGGGAVSCVAPLAGAGSSSAGLPSITTPSLDNGDAPAPKAAPVGLVTPQLPSGSLPAMKSGTLLQLKSSGKKGAGKDTAAKGEDYSSSAPSSAPELPSGLQPVNPPPVRDAVKPPAGLRPPVIDSEGKPIPGARLMLDSDVSTISFKRGSDQLDKDAVEICEKLTRILLANGNARITLVAYSDTDGTINPREARRISLNRALSVRDFMAAKGVSSGRVDVRPMGANVPSGDMDRVDVKVN